MYSRSTLLKMAFSLEKVLHVSRSRINHQFYNTIGLNTLYVSSSHFWPLNNQSDRSLFPMVFSWSSWYSRTTLSSTVSLTSCNDPNDMITLLQRLSHHTWDSSCTVRPSRAMLSLYLWMLAEISRWSLPSSVVSILAASPKTWNENVFCD